jgi:hypothetical protein
MQPNLTADTRIKIFNDFSIKAGPLMALPFNLDASKITNESTQSTTSSIIIQAMTGHLKPDFRPGF